ncbi:hypothetical protein T552_00596 [Pneumocystis carinii B80]|uniref:Anaphase-promoting complex subunit 4 WD40 domain-containing protein n=1 Tax=Pneumocystis carinii (strain B80) TaxID=1408658 RepID=A0A0W4ZP41_PNEC8|nr:hypothetical protein T552_00596 [Pneumocystis carinii B80]KTW30118.1 hypothetical protein T552_00596 [Pneumocystis carinii B80]
MDRFLFLRSLGAQSSCILRRMQYLRSIWSMDSEPVKRFKRKHFGNIQALVLDNNVERYLLSGGTESLVCLWDLEGEKDREETCIDPIAFIPVHSGHKYEISDINWWSFDQSLFTTSSFDHLVKDVCSFDLEDKVYAHSLSLIASHCLIACGTDSSSIRLCDLKTGAFTHSLRGHEGSVLTVLWSPRDEYTLISGGSDGSVRLWDVRRAISCLKCFHQYNLQIDFATQRNCSHNGPVNGLGFTSDGFYLVSVGHDEVMRLWDLQNGLNMFIHYGQKIKNTHFQKTSPYITHSDESETPLTLFPSNNSQIHIFDLFHGNLIKTLNSMEGKVSCVIGKKYSAEFYSGNDHQIFTWLPKKPT